MSTDTLQDRLAASRIVFSYGAKLNDHTFPDGRHLWGEPVRML
jgi:hypothetical protein